MDVEARLTLPGAVSAAGEARRFVARTLTPTLGREDVETAVLVTSELVTNAVVHARAGCEVVLQGGPPTLTIRVSDPVPSGHRGRFPTIGRGLRLLEVLCRRWGVESGQHGKTVWCEISVRPGRGHA